MSRSLAPLLVVLLVPGTPVEAQDGSYGPTVESAAEAEAAMANARQYWSSTPRERPGECDEVDPDPDTIVVCREWEDGEKYLFERPTRADTEVTGSGAPRAPDVFGMAPCSSYTVCVGFGSVPTPAYMIDFTTLPETPADSDAARLYGGPTTDDTAVEEPAPQSVP
ncbi:MAG: hypothetical protein V4647_06785 [Pseudomonadota bacterium]